MHCNMLMLAMHLMFPQGKKIHNAWETTQTGGGVPDLRQLTSMEERAMELAGGDGPSRMVTDSQVGVQHASEQKRTLNLGPPLSKCDAAWNVLPPSP